MRLEGELTSDIDRKEKYDVYNFLTQNNLTFLSFDMAAAMSIAPYNVKYNTIVSVLTRNGTGI